MTKRRSRNISTNGASRANISRKRGRPAKSSKATSAAGTDTLDSDVTELFDSDDHGWEIPLPEKDEPRVRRQMAARRKLEVYREAKQLEELICDWCFAEHGDRV